MTKRLSRTSSGQLHLVRTKKQKAQKLIPSGHSSPRYQAFWEQ